jgi:hypothetical protein
MMNAGDRIIFRGSGQPEAGIVLYSWLDENGDEDCYVALFGQPTFPTGPLIVKPMVLRYFAVSLELVDCEDEWHRLPSEKIHHTCPTCGAH